MKKEQRVKSMRLILLALATVTEVNAQKYAVHMTTPVHAGQRYAVTATGTSLTKASIGDRVLKATEYQVNFQGRAEVIQVDEKERPFKIAFTVERFTKAEGGVTVDLLKSGSVIVADGSQQQPISVEGGTLEEPVQEAFDLVYSTRKPGDVTDDETLGTKEAKGIGDSWPVNLALLTVNLKGGGVTIPAGHLSGSMAVVAKGKVGTTDCLSLRGEIKADDFISQNLQPDVTLDRASLQATLWGCYPIGESAHSYEEGAGMTTQVRLTTNQGDTIDIGRIDKRDVLWVAEGN